MIKLNNNVKFGLTVLVGLIFVISAVLKLLSVDAFELYIYSLQLFSYNLSTLIARFIIGFEFILGFFYLLNIYRKIIRITLITTLILFSLFLIIQYFAGSNDNCNCFGEYIKLNPIESLIKNLILLILVFISGNSLKLDFKFKKAAIISIVIIGIVIPSVISPPDFIYNAIYANNAENKIHTSTMLTHFIKENNLDKGKYIVCFFSLKCKYCKLTAHKISVISNRLNCKENVRYFFYGNKRNLDLFWSESKSEKLTYGFLESNSFFRISGGRVPVIFLINNGKLEGIFGYRTITEESVNTFLM